MIKPRFIARLDIKNEYLIKSIQLEGLKKIGDPNEYAIKYYKAGVDEIIFMDVVASLYGRNNLFEVIKKTAKNIFIPVTVGGGVRSEEDVENLLHSGADKICINTAAINNPRFINKLAKRFGSQCIVLSVDAKKKGENNWEAYTLNGREKTGLDVEKWIKQAIDLGIGEVVLTSVDYEGTGYGFDYNLVSKIAPVCKVPLIISGGLGELKHLKRLKETGSINGVAAARVLHYNQLSVSKIKKFLF